jgi:hypothetical protein
MDLMAINEGFIARSLEGLGEDLHLISPDGLVHTVKAQVVRIYTTAGEDSRGIAQGSRQLNKIASARATVRISTILEFAPNGDLHGWAARVRTYPIATSGFQVMYVEEAPDGDTSMGIRILSLVSVKRLTP